MRTDVQTSREETRTERVDRKDNDVLTARERERETSRAREEMWSRGCTLLLFEMTRGTTYTNLVATPRSARTK